MKKIAKYIKKKIDLIKKIKNEFKENKFAIPTMEILKNKIMIKIKNMSEKEKIETVYIEIREGIGGVESEIFTKDIFNMYKKYLETNKIFYDFLLFKKTKNGLKRIIIRSKGKNIYNVLKNESGVHRIQRIPKTEKKGRIHTSTCIVEIYKENKTNNKEITKKEIKIDTFKSRGPGGQSVNKTNSAVRITHIPTGITAECQKERSQLENKRYALIILESKLDKIEKEKIENKNKNERNKNNAIYSTRSSKIRTYNLAKNKIINHINKKTSNKVKEILYNGRIDILF
ncbi:Peptide chain release factor 1 [Candidatus Vidania fulgoroideae]|nr:Peptide chain release factor 1 [Candidatus Vidania fulgoroideae]